MAYVHRLSVFPALESRRAGAVLLSRPNAEPPSRSHMVGPVFRRSTLKPSRKGRLSLTCRRISDPNPIQYRMKLGKSCASLRWKNAEDCPPITITTGRTPFRRCNYDSSTLFWFRAFYCFVSSQSQTPWRTKCKKRGCIEELVAMWRDSIVGLNVNVIWPGRSIVKELSTHQSEWINTTSSYYVLGLLDQKQIFRGVIKPFKRTRTRWIR